LLRQDGNIRIGIDGRSAVGGFFMPGGQPARPYGELAQQWRELAERRRAHFIDLQQSGRWKHYYTEEQFLAEMQEAVRATETWARIASADKTSHDGT
jgi:hypothetical protein